MSKWPHREVSWESLELRLFQLYGHMDLLDVKKHPLENILALLSHLHSENTQLKARLRSGIIKVQSQQVFNHGKKQQGVGEVGSHESEQSSERYSPAGQAEPSQRAIIQPTHSGGTWHFIWDVITFGVFRE